MFNRVDPGKGLETVILSADGGSVKTMNGIRFEAHASFDPKALGEIMSDPASRYLACLRQVAAGARWVCSVCEGALLLARAGLLNRHKATTHWAFVDTAHKRFVESGNRLTGGRIGISSGLDEALTLIALLFDEETAAAVRLSTQYFPQPPVTGRIPAAPPCMVKW
jgi:transcriptional regulator GlxA family with amidase domain